MAVIQAGLGIATLLLIVPIPLAAAHQAGAVVLWTLLAVVAARDTANFRETVASPIPAG